MKRLISSKDVRERTALSRTSVWELTQRGDFPKPVKVVGLSKCLFVEEEIEAWIATRIAERDGAK